MLLHINAAEEVQRYNPFPPPSHFIFWFVFLDLYLKEPSFSVQSNSHHLGDCLSGTVAEANGMWLTATKAAVALVQPCSYHSRQLFMDFEQAGGYNVLLSLLEGSKVGCCVTILLLLHIF